MQEAGLAPFQFCRAILVPCPWKGEEEGWGSPVRHGTEPSGQQSNLGDGKDWHLCRVKLESGMQVENLDLVYHSDHCFKVSSRISSQVGSKELQ